MAWEFLVRFITQMLLPQTLKLTWGKHSPDGAYNALSFSCEIHIHILKMDKRPGTTRDRTKYIPNKEELTEIPSALRRQEANMDRTVG